MPAKRSLFSTADRKLVARLREFAAIAARHLTELGLTDADIARLTEAADTLEKSIQAVYAAQCAARAATVGKNESRRRVEKIVRAQVRRIQARTDVPDTLKEELRITVAAPRRAFIPIFTPIGVKIEPHRIGGYCLSWKGNGNTSAIIYRVEARWGNAAAWVNIGHATRCRFFDTGFTPGIRTRFRVRAERGKQVSDFSDEVCFPA